MKSFGQTLVFGMLFSANGDVATSALHTQHHMPIPFVLFWVTVFFLRFFLGSPRGRSNCDCKRGVMAALLARA